MQDYKKLCEKVFVYQNPDTNEKKRLSVLIALRWISQHPFLARRAVHDEYGQWAGPEDFTSGPERLLFLAAVAEVFTIHGTQYEIDSVWRDFVRFLSEDDK